MLPTAGQRLRRLPARRWTIGAAARGGVLLAAKAIPSRAQSRIRPSWISSVVAAAGGLLGLKWLASIVRVAVKEPRFRIIDRGGPGSALATICADFAAASCLGRLITSASSVPSRRPAARTRNSAQIWASRQTPFACSRDSPRFVEAAWPQRLVRAKRGGPVVQHAGEADEARANRA